ncbi:MAG: hypothetical protein ABSB31_02880 [Dehalococcoidia bacterium]
MRRILGTLVALVVAISFVLIPATVSADLGKCTGWDKVKWEDNPTSWNLYLQHWGRTPVTAMSTLAGLCGPGKLCVVCDISKCAAPAGNSSTDNVSVCTSGCWGKSVNFANKSWAPAELGSNPLVVDSNLNHGVTAQGGDWGITGCQHPECVSSTWCLQNNLLSHPLQ